MIWKLKIQFENLEPHIGERIDTEGLSQAIEVSQVGGHLNLYSIKMAWSTDPVLIKYNSILLLRGFHAPDGSTEKEAFMSQQMISVDKG